MLKKNNRKQKKVEEAESVDSELSLEQANQVTGGLRDFPKDKPRDISEDTKSKI